MTENDILKAMGRKNVIVAFSLNSIAGRNCLSGVFDYVNEGHDWSLQFLQNPEVLTATYIKRAIADGIDGFITGFRSRTSGLRALEESRVPTVLTDYPLNDVPRPDRNNLLLRNDDIAIGRTGANDLLSHGTFRSFAFVATPEKTRWSTLRERGFRLQLGERGVIPTTCRRLERLHDFLLGLPKPAALMAATDYVGVRVIEECRKADIRVPEQVAVLGVDNDELLCQTTRPTLSSICPDHEGLGRMSAEALDCLMNGRRLPARIHPLIHCTGVVERDSTRVVPPAGYVVREALAYIRRNAGKGIRVDDVVRHSGISRRLLYLRFKQMNGKSIHESILETRLTHVLNMLTKTTAPLSRIAAECGFASANRLSHLFAERFGMSPGAYRANARRHPALCPARKPGASPRARK